MSNQGTKKEKSLLWLIFPAALGLTMLFAFVNHELNMGERTAIAPEKHIDYSSASAEKMPEQNDAANGEQERHAAPTPDTNQVHSMPQDTVHAGASHH